MDVQAKTKDSEVVGDHDVLANLIFKKMNEIETVNKQMEYLKKHKRELNKEVQALRKYCETGIIFKEVEQ